MSLRQRLLAKRLPQRTITLPPVAEGGAPDEVTVRALPAPEWDALLQLHPPTPEQAEHGWAWNLATFRPALLAACVLSPTDEDDPLDATDWAHLLAHMPFGDRELLWNAALDVNENRWPGPDQGKRLDVDHLFAAQMDYCGPLGLPRSTFLGWDRDDQDAALTWSMRRLATHAACGTRPEEWDPRLGGAQDAYVADFRGCRGCEVKASAENQLPKDAPAGAHVVLLRNPRAGGGGR